MLLVLMRRALPIVSALAAAGLLSACGSRANLPANESASVKAGAQLFSKRCLGCHTLATVNALGSATRVRDRERVDGPNFNVRKEKMQDVLYAIRNGGFSGAIMPQNIVVGQDADHVAAFLSKYSGLQKTKSADSTK